MKSRALIPIVVGLIAVVSLLACHGGDVSKNKAALRVAITGYPTDAISFIAKEKGFFQQNNVEVELVFCKEMNEARRLFMDKKIDGIFDIIQDEIRRQTQGFDSKIVFVQDVSKTNDAIISKPNIKKIEDLKGKIISVDVPYSFSHVFVEHALSKRGLKEWDYHLRRVDATEMIKALDSGEIDAGHTWEPMLSEALKKGYIRLVGVDDDPYMISDVIAFSAESRADRAEDIAAFLKAYLEAQRYYLDHKEESLEILSRNTNAAKDDIESGLKGAMLGDLAFNRKILIDGDPTLYAAIADMMTFYDNRGLISLRLKPEALFDNKMIQGIK